jgi:branched-chain amino acid transport system ATP-binding protein
MTSVLRCEGLDAGYGDTSVVRGFDFELEAGEVVALLGPNGAGKTTILLSLAGLLPSLGGSTWCRGHDVTTLGAAKVSRRGLVLVPDDRSLFTTLTVRENLSLARRRDGPSEGDVLAYFPQLRDRLRVPAGALSGGEQQMLAIGRALMQRPQVLLIDELSMGLAPIVVERLLPVLRQVATDTGAGVLFVEQHVGLALGTADRAVVLVHGRTVLTDSAASLLADPARLEQAYLSGLAADAS